MRGLYAITPDTLDTDRLIGQVRSAIAGGANIVQYRGKSVERALASEQANALRVLTRHTGALFIVNDDSELAISVEADGIHIGRDDGDLDAISRIRQSRAKRVPKSSGTSFLIGVSCYNQLSRAKEAVAAGADYIAFGSFFPSSTKPDAVRAELSLISQAKKQLAVPVVAIGGITVDNAYQLVEARVDAIAVIAGLFGAEDIEQRAREFSNLFKIESHVYQ
jgi:thiamine-phosphate pyrophosphorylase